MTHTHQLQRCKWVLNDLDNGIKYVEKFGKEIIPEFVIDQDNLPVIRQLIKYFNGYEDFSPKPGIVGDLTKGLLLLGGPGTGKTSLMKIFSKYVAVDEIHFIADGKIIHMKNFEVKPVTTIISEFQKDGFPAIDKYANKKFACFDDLGLESKDAVYFGSRVNMLEQIIMRRYFNNVLTLATSNYTMEALGEMYGAKVLSRIYEMFNIIVMTGKDRRLSTVKMG